MIARRQRAWNAERAAELERQEACGMPRFLPLLTVPIAAFVVLIVALVIIAIV